MAVAGIALFSACQTARADQLLVTNNDSLTTYKVAGTQVQGVRPRAEQRGVGLDGARRSGGALPWALAGNPFESGQAGEALSSIRLATGTYSPMEVDLAFPAQVPWVVGRTFNARQADSGGTHFDSNGYQGKNWFQISQPEIRLYDADSTPSTKQAADLIYLVYGADRYVEFKRTDNDANTFRGVNGAAGVFKYEAGSPDLYVYTDQQGNRTYFFGGNTASDRANWQVWKFVDPAGNTAYVGHATTASSAVSDGYNADGTISKAFDSSGRRYCYSYTTIDDDSRLDRVTAEINAEGGWGDCGSETLVGKVEYDYYSASDQTHGPAGHLKLVTVTTPLSFDSQVQSAVPLLARKQHYRYYTQAYDNSAGRRGGIGMIKMVIGPEGCRRFDWGEDGAESPPVLDNGFLTASDSSLKPYADAYFEYPSGGDRVWSVYFDGECGCSGGANGEYKLTYDDTNPGFSGTSGYDTAWNRRVVIEPPTGGAWSTQYFDELGQPLSRVLTDATPGTGTPATWVTQIVRNSDGQVTEVHTPANVSGYMYNTSGNPDGSITTSGSAGLVHYYQRIASGDTKGFLEGVRQKEGSSNLSTNSTFLSWTQYLTRDLNIASGVNVTRPMVEKTRAFHTATTDHTDTTKYDETTQAYTWWENSTTTDVLYFTGKQITTTAPAVSTAKNGSGSATTTKRYMRKDGTTAFTESARGIFSYTAYTGGQATKRIEDVKTNGTFPAGDDPNTDWGITENGDGFDRTTEYTYDNQGRSRQTTLPSGRVTMTWYDKIGDDRLATFSIPRVASYHGPAGYTVSNHAGSTEACFTIAILEAGTSTHPWNWLDHPTSSASTMSADPITAFVTSSDRSLSRLTASAYTKTGRRLDSRRVFFTMPTSLSGTITGMYDEWTVAYDHVGRQIRTKDPTGTISRTVYDVLGRVTSREVGTDDTGDLGSNLSGTNNMTTTESLVYDGGSSGGNSLLTTRTQFVADSTTGQRQTVYHYDYRGRLVLSVGPQAPFSVVKYDHRGRTIASGAYSISSGLSASTDPTSTTSNRISLHQTFYDERGQVWKSQRHKITQDTGADADTLLSLNWYDPDGRLIKADAEQLTKTRYDRLGRTIQSFTLANDNDSTYSDVYDTSNKFASLAGDTVLEERQIGYNGKLDNVFIQATIARNHTDTTTTGPLDLTYDGGDGLPLKYTAADVKGRIQISAMWYDALDRPTTTAFYGTNAATDNVATFERDVAAPTASDTNPTTRIVTKTVYNDDGTVKQTVDPNGRVTRVLYDAAGRTVASIANYTGGSTSTALRDTDVYTRYEYTNTLQSKVWVDVDGDNVVDSDDQVTLYTYGTPKGTPGSGSPTESAIATGHLLREATYPPQSSGQGAADRTVTYAYNAQGEQVWSRDQAGNVIETEFDTAGRETHRRVTTLASGFDGAVRRISTTYLTRGMVNKVTQYSNATPGSGSVVNDLQYTYDDWGNLGVFKQDVDSEIGASPSGRDPFQVDYTYAKATTGRNTIRRTGVNLPGATAVTFDYLSTSGRLDDDASRVTRVKVATGGTPIPVTQYEYLGVGQVVGTNLLEPQARWNYYETASGGNPYPDLDRFNRVEDSRWTSYKGTGTRDFYSIAIAFDPASNILGITDYVHKSGAGHRNFDVLYSLDALNRLTRAEEGTLASGAISNRSRDELWQGDAGALALSQTGNWMQHRLDLNGDGVFTGSNELKAVNDFSLANELTTRDINADSTIDYTLTYDKAGHQTDDGKIYTYVYDAFGRLRQIKHRTTNALISEHTYNALGFRVGWHYDANADAGVDGDDPWYWFAYDDQWRIVATFRDEDADPKEVFVHHAAGLGGFGGSSYIDGVILRDRDIANAWTSDADNKRTERRYYCQNWRADVSAILTDDGSMVEWVKYSAYGVPFGLPAGDTDSDGDWDGDDKGRIGAGAYDVRKDVNLDGVEDSDDVDQGNAVTGGNHALGRGVLSAGGVGGAVSNRRGYAGYEYAPELEGTGAAGRHLYHVRNRVYDADVGRWTRRDPLGYVDGMGLYEYVKGMAVITRDASGLLREELCCLANCSIAKCLEAKRLADEAFRETERRFPGSGIHNGEGDAFRHCFWSCSMKCAWGITDQCPLYIGNCHEDAGNRNGQPKSEEIMDKHNNKVGRNIGLDCLGNTDCTSCCANTCEDAVKDGRLRTSPDDPRLPDLPSYDPGPYFKLHGRHTGRVFPNPC